MKILLDTCTALWFFGEAEKLSKPAMEAISDGANEVILHQVSVLEIQIKYLTGKLSLRQKPGLFVPQAVKELDLVYERLSDAAIYFLEKLPSLHRDPFDRLLISHALVEGWTIATPDPLINQYPVPVLW